MCSKWWKYFLSHPLTISSNFLSFVWSLLCIGEQVVIFRIVPHKEVFLVPAVGMYDKYQDSRKSKVHFFIGLGIKNYVQILCSTRISITLSRIFSRKW